MSVYSKKFVVPGGVRCYREDCLAEVGYFHVGGRYVPCHNDVVGDDLVMEGQVYIEAYVPKQILHPYPLLLFHGNGQSGVGFMQTLEGKPGWVHDFLSMGYVVYVADQPERGRSVCHTSNGPRLVWPAKDTARLFCTPGGYAGSEHHTQWPGEGCVGDPVYDAFYMTQIDSLASAKRPQELIREAGQALFETLGPVILLCHSQSGPFAWILANDHPESVKAMISIEPSGPPFTNVQTGTPLVGTDGHPTNYGISHVPLTFAPPLSSPAEIELEPQPAPDASKVAGFLPKQPARQLPRLQGIPTLVLSAEASYHTSFDYLTAMFLKQAGVDVEYVMLGDVGIHGNGHMMMIEKNSRDISQFLDQWICRHQL